MTTELQALICRPRVVDRETLRLHARLGEVQRRCETRGLDVGPLGVGRFTRRPSLTAVNGADWLVMPWSIDPLVTSGRMAIPRAQRRDLAVLARLDLDLAEVLIAHEMPPEWAGAAERDFRSRPVHPAEWEQLMRDASVPAPAATMELGELMAGVIERAAAKLTGMAWGLVHSAQGAVTAVATGLDPVLIGVVGTGGTIREGDPAGFIVLTRWVW